MSSLADVAKDATTEARRTAEAVAWAFARSCASGDAAVEAPTVAVWDDADAGAAMLAPLPTAVLALGEGELAVVLALDVAGFPAGVVVDEEDDGP